MIFVINIMHSLILCDASTLSDLETSLENDK